MKKVLLGVVIGALITPKGGSGQKSELLVGVEGNF